MMYSKDRGVTFQRGEMGYTPLRREPSYRQSDRPRMQVPPNYSGHAIVDGEERPLGQLPEVDIPEESPNHDLPTPHFDGLPRVSDLGDNRRRPPVRTVSSTFEEPDTEGEDGVEESDMDTVPVSPSAPAQAQTSLPTTPRGALFDLTRFPFGHGIGTDELLIIGLILFLLHENASCEERGDIDETVILLGLLLLLG